MFRYLRSALLLTSLFCSATTYAQVPPGYEVIDVHQTDVEEHGVPRMNDCGEIVFSFGPIYADWTEVLRYDNGFVQQVTENDHSDAFPDINNCGDIAWNPFYDSFGGGEIWLREAADIINLGNGLGPAINASSQIAWSLCESEDGCGAASIWLFDGVSTQMIMAPDLSHQSAKINDSTQIAWTAYDFPPEFWGWTSEIMLYDDGLIQTLPTEMETPQGVAINNLGQVAWSNFDFIDLWSHGVTQTILEGHGASLNDRGHIAFSRLSDPVIYWQIWVLRDDTLYAVTADPTIASIRPEINNFGEIVWWWHPNGQLKPSGIRLMRRIRNGDVDFDDDVDLADFVGPDWKTGHPSDAVTFSDCLTGPVDTDRLCDCRFFDMGHDRDVDIADFAMFANAFGAQIEYPPSYPPPGNCCEANPEFEPGCTSSLVEECVCEVVSSCCTEHWNASCALVADALGCTEFP